MLHQLLVPTAKPIPVLRIALYVTLLNIYALHAAQAIYTTEAV